MELKYKDLFLFNCTFLRNFKIGGITTKGKETKGRWREVKPEER
jgi:hypothetical protein